MEADDLLVRRGPGGSIVRGPDFLIIGAPRAGTTWLKRALSRHPDLFILRGEPAFFSGRMEEGLGGYADAYATGPYLDPDKDVHGQRKLFGEKSPTYLIMPEERIALVAAHYPDVKLICTIREPVSRAMSHLAHLENRGLPASLAKVAHYSRYEDRLRLWGRHFSAEQFLLIDFDHIRQAPLSVYEETVRHIGARPHIPDSTLLDPLIPTVARAATADVEAALGGEVYDVSELRHVIAGQN